MIFLSYFLDQNTPAYGGLKAAVKIQQTNAISAGNTSNNTSIELPVHIGTHIDFPRHFSDMGKTMDDYPADFWLFSKVGFLECAIEEVPERLQGTDSDIELLILKTGFGSEREQMRYWAEQPVIPAHFARLFKEHFPMLRVFGFDMISLTSKLDRAEGKKAHISFLLENEILIVEDMNLAQLQKTPEKVLITPLMIAHADGAPCTVIAF
jgi:kynurenine formamidase